MTARASRVPSAGQEPRPIALNLIATFLPLSENWIYDQAVRLSRYRPVFAARHLSNLAAFPMEEVHSISRLPLAARLREHWTRRRTGRSPFFVKTAETTNAKLLHAHSGNVAARAVGVADATGLPLIASFYGVDMWKHEDGIPGLQRKYADLFERGSLFLAEGPAAGERLVRIGCDPARIVIHRLGVDVANIPVKLRALGRGQELHVLMASRFVEKKGLRYGAEAFARVAKDYPMLRLTVVGRGSASRERAIARDIDNIAKHYGVSAQVSVRGFMQIDEFRLLANRHHVLMHPSVQAANGDSEGGHPVVMTMLAASGMPILATRHCDIPEIVADGQTGWLVNEKDVHGLEEVLRSIIHNPSVLSEFGKRARTLVETRYDLRCNPLDDVYDRVLAR